MIDYKFEVEQIVFVLPVKMNGVIKKHIKPFTNEKTYEVEIDYKNRAWKATFYESELSDIKESPLFNKQT